MKTKTLNARNVARKYNRQSILKIKRIRTEPRQRIRQLLRSFVPLNSYIMAGDTSNDDTEFPR